MLQIPFLSLALTTALAAQVPLNPNRDWKTETQAVLCDQDLSEWSLHSTPNPNSTDHLVFETVHSFLQHWPNTRMRNGHNIVPGIVPKGTLLYHSASAKQIPTGPEWVSTDPEHSYLFCYDEVPPIPSSNLGGEDCLHVTFAAARPLKIVYFDGSGAAKMPYGSMDTQDLLAWGVARPEDMWKEYERADGLCAWGKDFGVDGFARMEMDFEIILCDFTTGLDIVSLATLHSFSFIPPFWPPFGWFEVVNAGSWHNRLPGETRIQLDLAGLVSFYDTQLVPSLVSARAGQERWDHRVRDISAQDLSALKSRLGASLIRPSGQSSGFDWRTLVQVVADRFSGRLEMAHYLLNSSATTPEELLDLANKTHTQLRIMLTPYILFSARPTNTSNKKDLDWARPIYKLCSTTHTDPMVSVLNSMTDSEKLIRQAIRGTSREICRVVTKMWAAGVYAGLDLSLNTKESLDVAEVAEVWKDWTEDLNQLMRWLDWSAWVKCNPTCGPEEICYLPTWPFGFPYSPIDMGDEGGLSDSGRRQRLTGFELRAMATANIAREMSDAASPVFGDWERPQPGCLRRIDPYKF